MHPVAPVGPEISAYQVFLRTTLTAFSTIGWPWSFYFVSIFTAACLPLIVFFVPETAYRRSAHLNTDMASTDDLPFSKNAGASDHGKIHEMANPADPQGPVDLPVATEAKQAPGTQTTHAFNSTKHNYGGTSTPKKSFTQQLLPFSGRVSDESFFKLFLRPFPLFAHPAVLWACLIQGTMIGWTVFIGIILAAVFLGPPLFWNEVNTGYAYTGAFIGAIVGFLIAGGLADWSAKFMTKRNGGVYEPEFRIVLVFPQLVFGCTGLFLFGVTASRLADYSWVLPVFAFGLEVGGMVIGAVAASLYIVDAHREFSCFHSFILILLTDFFR